MGLIRGPKPSKLLFGFRLLLRVSLLGAFVSLPLWRREAGRFAQFPGLPASPGSSPGSSPMPDQWHKASDFAGHRLLGQFSSPTSGGLKKSVKLGLVKGHCIFE